MTNKPIFVTQPFLPPLDKFVEQLEKIWDNKVLTNNGPFHQELEAKLCDYLGVKHISIFNNGTIALLTALQALRVTGKVITTPFSFVATAHSILWNGLEPVFVDIDPVSLNMDPNKIEAAITPQTTAILPVHCYGTPCDVDHIQRIADTYGLKVIYDAAHAFGVKRNGESILQCGDLSVLSFHATKVFNTIEGGAIISPDEKTKKRIDYLKNFGFADEVTVVAPGINGKMNEVQAAFGLTQLEYINQAISSRSRVDQLYRKYLANVPGVNFIARDPNVDVNHSYFPILIDDNYPITRDELYEKLKQHGIFSRRYFYPLISDMPMYRGFPSAARHNLPVATEIAQRVLCLPIYASLSEDDQLRIIDVIRK